MRLVNSEITIAFTFAEAIALRKLLGNMSTSDYVKFACSGAVKDLNAIYEGMEKVLPPDGD